MAYNSFINFSVRLNKTTFLNDKAFVRNFSVQSPQYQKDKYKLLIIGGGAGGLATSSRFVKKLGANNVAVVDGSEWHYYQAGWTLVGGGLKTADQVRKSQKGLITNGVDWIKSNAASFDPENNSVILDDGKKINYDYLVVAAGIATDFERIKGLNDALANDDTVVSMYSHENVKRVFPAIQNFKGGNAVFTFPMVPIKCPGAPQKICYLAEDYFRRNGLRDKAVVTYYTTLPAIFGVKKYAASLMKVIKSRDINLVTRHNLVEVDYKNKTAILENLDQPGQFVKQNYSLLHVCPPMKPHEFLKNSKIVDTNGFVDVNKETLQHQKYSNVFAIGDCTNIPTGKTAAAVAAQSEILEKNLKSLMDGKSPSEFKYNGYASCPLVTGYGKLILAEFDFDGQPLETFPFDQSKESRAMYHLKKDAMAEIYWYGLIKGLWGGPDKFRQISNLIKQQS